MTRPIVDVAFGYSITSASPVWTDITRYADLGVGISITRGASNEVSETEPGQAGLTLDNSDGRFTPGRSASPYYPNVKKNVPIRVRVVSADQNLITNPSFESGLTDWTPSATPAIAQSTTHVKVGSQAMLMTFGGGGVSGQSAATTVYGLDVGQTYTVSAYVWVPTGDTHVHLRVEGGPDGSASTIVDAWQRITCTFTATATQHLVRIRSATTPAAGDQVWIDAVQLWEGSSPKALNHLVNGDFETSISDWSSSGTPTIARSTAQAQRGTASMLITWGAVSSQSVRSTISGLTVGTTYTASSYVRVPAGDQAVRLKVADTGGTDFAFGSYSTLIDTWQQITCTFTATETSAQLRINPNTPTGAGDIAYVDAVQVEEGSSPTAYSPLDGAQIHARYFGMVNAWPLGWKGLQSQTVINCTDIFKWAGLERELLPMLCQEILLDRPTVYFPLSEPADSVSAGDLSGTAGVGSLAITQAGVGGTLEFDAGTGPVGDGLGCPVFTPASSTAGKYLTADLGQQFQDANLSRRVRLEVWFTTSTSGRVLLALTSADLGTKVIILLESGTGKVTLEKAQDGSSIQTTVFATPNVADGALHHLVYNEFTDEVVVDGTTYTSTCFNQADLRMLAVGGYQGQRLWSGTIAQLAIYCTTITTAEAAAHYTTGTTEHIGELASARMSRLASYVGLTVTSQGTVFDAMASQATLGRSALEHLRDVEGTESGKLLASRTAASLVFQSRSLRYNPTAAVSLAYADLETDDVQYADDDQKTVNDATASRVGGATQRVISQTSIDTYGPKPQNLELLKNSDNSVTDALNWLVSRYADPPPEIRQVPIEAYSMPLTTYRALLDADVSTIIGLTGLPDQAPASTATVIVEGYSEHIGQRQHHIDFHTSRADTDNVWILDDATYSMLDSTTRLAY